MVWGPDLHTNYAVAAQAARRKTTEFSRNLALALVSMAMKTSPSWASTSHFAVAAGSRSQSSSSLLNSTALLVRDGRPLNVVVYTRGSNHYGRSILGEEALVQAVQARGGAAFLCCDFGRMSLYEQLHIATQADVVSDDAHIIFHLWW